MKRGEIWTVASGGSYSRKPRPAVIVQDDAFSALDSIAVCPFTSVSTETPLFRILIEPDEWNNLVLASRLMVDKLAVIRRAGLGRRVGILNRQDVLRLNGALAIFLGLSSVG